MARTRPRAPGPPPPGAPARGGGGAARGPPPAPRAGAEAQELTALPAAGPLPCAADRSAIERILGNLVANGLAHAPRPGGHVTVEAAAPPGGEGLLAGGAEGAGIPPPHPAARSGATQAAVGRLLMPAPRRHDVPSADVPARPAWGRHGAVVSPHHLASAAGLGVLRGGGADVAAAIATDAAPAGGAAHSRGL